VALQSTSHYFLQGLTDTGIEYLFCNLGTDHAPIIEEMARWRSNGLRPPPTILCPHENVAVHMAGGYAWLTGRGQAVLVHVDAGTASAAMALHNLCRARTPALVMAGRAPFTLRGELPGSRDANVHFIQEPFDQAALVRPYVKWEYNLHSGIVAKEVLRRAHSVMHSDPMGPAYLTLPREVLSERWDEAAVRDFPAERYGPVRARGTDPATVTEIAERLLGAAYPILITRYAGRNAEFPALVDEFARFAGVRVFEAGALFLNIPHDSACYLGGAASAAVGLTDLGLLVDVDVPWIPVDTRENAATYWVHVDVDPLKEKMPVWGFPSHLRVQGDSRAILAQLFEHLKATASPRFREAAQARLAAIERESAARNAALARAAGEPGAPGSISVEYLCAELGRALGPGDIVFNEAIRNAPAVANQIMRTLPGTMFGLPGGGLGFSGAAALGAKLARREALAVQICGDGSFYQCTPETVYAVAKHYELPIMTLVLDNSGWSAVKQATLRMYPQGEASRAGAFESVLAPEMDFAKVAQSAGAYGARIGHPGEVADAIRRCLAEVRSGRSALLHARVTPI
jgi:acetolactate synthase-1/2/3 large subunit